MVVFAVDDRGVLHFFVLLDAVPDLGNPGAGGVDDGAAFVVEHLHLLDASAKGGQDDDVPGGNDGKVFLALFDGNEAHFHFPQAVVDRGIVDDFVGDPEALGGEVLAGFVGHGDGALDAPAKSEGLGEANGDLTALQLVVVVADFLNQVALVLGLEDRCDFCFVTESFPVVVFRFLERSLEGFCVHNAGYYSYCNGQSSP